MPAVAARAENRLLLHNISWETYERLLGESIDNCGTRFTYNEGDLEIMVVSIGHERPNRALALLVEFTASESCREFIGTGSTTFRRKDALKGFEPDSSFYFVRADAVRDLDEIDLATDPPPELVIEVAISSSSLNRFPIFAAVGVQEIWRYDGERVQFHELQGNTYRQIEASAVLPPMTSAQATIFLNRFRKEKTLAWERAVRAWVRGHRP